MRRDDRFSGASCVFLHASVVSLLQVSAWAAQLVVLNHGSAPITLKKDNREIAVGGHHVAKSKDLTFGAKAPISFLVPKVRVTLPNERYAVLVAEEDGTVTVHDMNSMQIELSAAATSCIAAHEQGGAEFDSCLGVKAFGGFPKSLAASIFNDLWQGLKFWKLCNLQEPAQPMRTQTTRTGHSVGIIREEPLVAVVKSFLTPELCDEIIGLSNLDDLVRAHEGTGAGGTSTTENRETLTTNIFVNWDVENALSVNAAKMFGLVSELSGEKFSFEGQEPINFLHYKPGFEYKPHYDGDGSKPGKRVATTLLYCKAAVEGGATVFPAGSSPIRFQPGPGDMLYFKYPPRADLTLHAACPVLAGNKTTLTQWYRPGVSAEVNWDNFEDWGKFHNPLAHTRWKGPRYDEQEL